MKLVKISMDVTTRSGEPHHAETHIYLSRATSRKVGGVCRKWIEEHVKAQGWKLCMATACLDRPAVVGLTGKTLLTAVGFAPSAYYDGELWQIR